jgi:hypothetical protein
MCYEGIKDFTRVICQIHCEAAHPAIMLWLGMYVCSRTSRGHLHVVPESVLLTLAERQENSSRIRKFLPNGPSLSACCQQVEHLHCSSKKSESPPEFGLILLVIMWFTVFFFSQFLEWVSLSLQNQKCKWTQVFSFNCYEMQLTLDSDHIKKKRQKTD